MPKFRGIGMLEFMVALLVFSMGMMGLLSVQLASKKVAYDATQRSIATTLARDILERIRTNSEQLKAYEVQDVGDLEHLFSSPEMNCDSSTCTAAQLAEFDLWQWELSLLGMSEQQDEAVSGGMILPRACITNDAGVVEVSISWLGMSDGNEPAEMLCGGATTGVDNPEDDVEGAKFQRHQLMISTYIAPD